VSVQRIAQGQTDVRAELVKARASGANTLFTVGYDTETTAIINGLYTMNWHPILADGSGVTADPGLLKTLGAKADNVFGPTDYDPGSADPANQKFVTAFEARFGMNDQLEPAIHSYESIQIVIAGLEQGPASRTGLGALLYHTVVPDQGDGALKFDRHGNPIDRPMYLYVIKNDKITYPYKYVYTGTKMERVS
jgi:ABC-type branched-subunit amino acid transport system substrate-binding protein